jgi:tetratricopeptide (TPR) repeat protein
MKRNSWGVVLPLAGVVAVVAGGLQLWSLRGGDPYVSSYNAGDYSTVLGEAADALKRNPDDIQALLAAATTYAMQGSVGFAEASNGQLAIEYADKALALDPRNAEAYRIKGYALEIQERYDEAHQAYDRAIALNPRHFQALSNKGHAYDLQGDFANAERLYLRSLEVAPEGEHALLNVARLFVRQGKAEEAKRAAQKLVETSGNSRFVAEACQLLAELYRGEKQYREAQKFIELSTEKAPAIPQVWVSRGRIELALFLEEGTDEGEMLRRVSSYAEKAVAINPNQASALALLSEVEMIKGNKVGQEEYKQRALAAIPKDITLGQREKEGLRQYLSASIVVSD